VSSPRGTLGRVYRPRAHPGAAGKASHGALPRTAPKRPRQAHRGDRQLGDLVASRGPRGVRGARERRGPPRHTPPGANCDRGLRRASRTHPRAHPKHKITNGYKRASAGALRMAHGVRPRSRGRRRASKASRWSSMTTMSHRFSRVAGPRGTTRPRARVWRVTAQTAPQTASPASPRRQCLVVVHLIPAGPTGVAHAERALRCMPSGDAKALRAPS
jgi:hypothetical protein